ncbi:hypothetical protein [Staphylococcus pasteuri]|uniref:hypothetical protein n=1 Tax=Staphylococcus pasteuri TaxID=45972 RepID=UPI001F290A08|nr:hypothetical protein [Staphylococcus pasteuri]
MDPTICKYIMNGVWFVIGAFLSSIILIPFEETLLQFLRNYWLLFSKKAVKGSIIKCSIYPNKGSIENILLSSQFAFKVKLPYQNISEDHMDIKESNQIIVKAITNKYGIDLQKNNYKLNNVSPIYNVIIHKNDLDYKKN